MSQPPFQQERVEALFASYPTEIRDRLLSIRSLIFSVGKKLDGPQSVEETLKWGEPSYATITGSAVRLAWKKSDADNYRVCFHCGTSLIETFRKLYAATLRFEGNRAIAFHKDDPIPVEKLEKCIHLALTYHQRKRLPLLGA